jgi:uncharacterized damage-inducible protein DinB
MTHTESLLAELTRETEATRRLLERIPEDRLAWAPHPKSMSLGQLGLHVAGLTGGVATLIDPPSAEVPTVPLPAASSVAEILAALDASVAVAAARIADWGDDGLRATWTMTQAGSPVLQLPRGEMVRSILLNHWYHHRGQLTVYLRLLGVALPQIYGPTADEAP